MNYLIAYIVIGLVFGSFVILCRADRLARELEESNRDRKLGIAIGLFIGIVMWSLLWPFRLIVIVGRI